jgi:hypothetical protein
MTSSTVKGKKRLDDYTFVNNPKKNTPELGKGAFGEVRLAKDNSDG